MPARVPDLNTDFVPDLAKADRNALATMRGRQQNVLAQKQLGNYDQDRAMAMEDRQNALADRQFEVDQRPAKQGKASLDMLYKAMPMLTLQNWEASRDYLVKTGNVPEQLLPSMQEIQQNADQYHGGDPQTAFDDLKKTWQGLTEQGGQGAAGQLTPKNTQEVDYYDEERDRWMVKKQRWNPQTGAWDTFSDGPKSNLSQPERDAKKLKKDLPAIESFRDRKGPMATYADGYRMNSDGSLYKDATGMPVKLPSFEKVTGKRGNIKAIIAAGQQLDDSIEVMELLQDPEVQSQLQGVKEPGFFGRLGNMGVNKLRKWSQEAGIGANTKAYEVLIRMQRMASEERKRLLGAAVTTTEMQSILSWMPDSGDNFDSIVSKMNVGVYEAAEGFKHWLSAFEDNANMAPFYKAFGWDRFNMPGPDSFTIKVNIGGAPSAGGGQEDLSTLSNEELMQRINGG